jgi:hypothetical protein
VPSEGWLLSWPMLPLLDDDWTTDGLDSGYGFVFRCVPLPYVSSLASIISFLHRENRLMFAAVLLYDGCGSSLLEVSFQIHFQKLLCIFCTISVCLPRVPRKLSHSVVHRNNRGNFTSRFLPCSADVSELCASLPIPGSPLLP